MKEIAKFFESLAALVVAVALLIAVLAVALR